MTEKVDHETMAAEMAAQITDALIDELEEHEKGRTPPEPRLHGWISQYHPCAKHLYHRMANPRIRGKFTPDRLAAMRRGRNREVDVKVELANAGKRATPPFTVEGGSERVEVSGKDGLVIASGKIDWSIAFQMPKGRPMLCPVEHKDWHPNLTQNIHTFEDCFENPWTRAGGMQALLYAYSKDLPIGFLYLSRPGLPKILPIVTEDHYELIETYLQDQEAAVLARLEKGPVPDFIKSPVECHRCDFMGKVCDPPIVSMMERRLADPELEAMMEERHDLADAARQHKRLDETIKKELKRSDNEEYQAFCGMFQIDAKRRKRKAYSVKESEFYVFKITRVCEREEDAAELGVANG